MELELRWISARSLDAELAGDRDLLSSEIGAVVNEWPPDGGEWDRDSMQFFRQIVGGNSFEPQWGPTYVVRDGRVVASAGFHGPPDDAGEVEVGFSVCRSERRQGVATATVALLCDVAARGGCGAIRARTSIQNAGSVATLQRNGFVEVERSELDGGEPRVLFRRKLR